MGRKPAPDLVALQGLYHHSTTDQSRTTPTARDAAPAAVPSTSKARLLRIHSPFLFSLDETTLKDDEYVALSHHWEKDFSLCPVTINNREYKIRSYVYEMLHTIYYVHGECCVWMDMLCINQSSETEKKKQIRLMGDIFGKARRVYAWLGSATPNTDNIFDVLNEFAEEKGKRKYQHPDSCIRLMWYRDLLELIYEDRIGALPAADGFCDKGLNEEVRLLAPLFTRHYWRRLWIVQELILAKEVTVCCGIKRIALNSIYGLGLEWGPWSHAFELGNFTQCHESTRGWNTMRAIQEHRRMRDDWVDGVWVQSPTINIPLDEVVVMYAKEHECEEIKDKILALRELVQERRERLDPTAHQSDKDLFRRAFELCFYKQEYRQRWTWGWHLWKTMYPDDCDGFMDFVKDYFSPDLLQKVKLEVLPEPLPCRRKSISVDQMIEACRNAEKDIPVYMMRQLEALGVVWGSCRQ